MTTLLRDTWGRFTARGSDALEAKLTELIEKVADACKQRLDPSQYRALIMHGGNGRGERAVELRDGEEFPHNNIDLMLITNDLSRADQAALQSRLEEVIEPLVPEYGIEMDLSTTTVSKLNGAPSLVMWYDMRFGHKTVLGDATFVPSLTHFAVERIPPADARNLLVNRGTLLVINQQLIENVPLDEKIRRTIIKHTMKGIIGYGDALLFFLGKYDWSYAEKQRRMRTVENVSPEFKALYDEALDFRFQPDYAAYLTRDLASWMAELRAALAPLHLLCESKRLNAPELDWGNYPDTALGHALAEQPMSPRAWAKKAVNVARGTKPPRGLSVLAGLGYRVLGLRGAFPVLFPVVAYELDVPRFRQIAAEALSARSTDASELRRAYLYQWGAIGDTNFMKVVRKWGLSLESQIEKLE